jgi:hypothetical protein
MMKFPSYSAAILTGAIGLPLFICVAKYIEKNSRSQVLMAVWFILGFGLPFLISTGDLGYIRRHFKGGLSFFRPWVTSEVFRQFLIPAWKRMGVWFVAAVVSVLLLKLLGVDI